jgi:uncharacterized membrane protein affecting hemolysin expression
MACFILLKRHTVPFRPCHSAVPFRRAVKYIFVLYMLLQNVENFIKNQKTELVNQLEDMKKFLEHRTCSFDVEDLRLMSAYVRDITILCDNITHIKSIK